MATIKRIAGPAYISNSAANIYTPPASTIYTIIRQIHIANVTNGTVTFSLFVGGTGGSTGGTQLEGTYSITAYNDWDRYVTLYMASTDFLTGIASAASSLVITVMGEQGVV